MSRSMSYIKKIFPQFVQVIGMIPVKTGLPNLALLGKKSFISNEPFAKSKTLVWHIGHLIM